MAINTIKLYKNTGLNGSNVIDSVSVMWNSPSSYGFNDVITLTGTFPLVQEKGLAELKIETTWEEINAVDYLIVMSPYVQGTPHCGYFVTAITMISTTVASLSLVVDALGTIGINNLSGIDAWCKRRIVRIDEQDLQSYQYGNLIQEDWAPENALEMDTAMNILGVDTANGFRNVVLSVSDLTEADDLAVKYKEAGAGSTDYVLVPQLDPVPANQQCLMAMFTEYDQDNPPTVPTAGTPRQITTAEATESSYFYPMAAAYKSNTFDCQVMLQTVRSLGVESSIIASYQVPVAYMDETTTTVSTQDPSGNTRSIIVYTSLTGRAYHVNTGLYFEYIDPSTYAVENKKVFAQYQTFEIVSIASGGLAQYKFEDLHKPASNPNPYTVFQCMVWANPAPNGKPYCRPFYYMGNAKNMWQGTVEGAEWQQAQIRWAGSSGAGKHYLDQDWAAGTQSIQSAANRAIAGLAVGAALLGFTGTGGTGASTLERHISKSGNIVTNRNIGEQVKRGAEFFNKADLGTSNAIANEMDIVEARRERYRANLNAMIPDIAYPYTANIQSFVGNDFTVNRYRLTLNDVKRFDEYLHKYGESVDEPFNVAHFTDKVKYNFVQLSNVNMPDVLNVPLWLKTLASTVLEAGVRIWHAKPTKAALVVGGNADA